MKYSLTTLFFASILVSSGSILPIVFAQNATSTLSPLAQFKMGISAYDVKCKEGFVLMMRTADSSPACVKPQTAQDLAERGWGIVEMITIPKLSDDQAAQIVRADLAKHLPNLDRVIIPGKDLIPDYPNYPKHPLPLIYVLPNDTQFTINNTDHSILRKCILPDASCFIRDKSALNATSGRLVYTVDLTWYTNTGVSAPTYYLIDAQNGDVLFSTLLQNIMQGKYASEYKP